MKRNAKIGLFTKSSRILMKKRLYPLIEQSLVACMEKGLLPEAPLPPFDIEPPREKAHGDYATNAAMVLASAVRRKPRDIARALVDHLDDAGGWIEKVEIAGPGFVNFFMKGETWAALLRDVDELRDRYGFSDLGRGRRVQVEFVSANPTGPLHIGHGRGAVVGDVIANLLTATGHAVSREYYINDAGNQMNTLAGPFFSGIGNFSGSGSTTPRNATRDRTSRT